jgi:hypothetical protein
MKTSKLISYTIAVAVVVVAGILAWRLTSPRPVATASATTNQVSAATPAQAQSAPAGTRAENHSQGEQVTINGIALTAEQIQAIETQYRTHIPPGKYWYDSRSGFWGLEGYAVAGYSQPGINFGQLSPRASNGNTGVFVNGRELNQAEANFFARIFGTYQPGRFWLDGLTGYVGYEGDPTPRDNLFARIRQS